ncbi:flavodoxin-dependent (E)-4-hydroxy-3-methylbut-2-enyl-diphosphate synthase [Christensenella sp. MSJ-20]|uniref:flavodoxin-dependent (E)-4-hydroxy-3-methylbut-2-enyl-diphosphate synthase n=1 Tax=Christensenella sp. MSJ-20 TaxID=2841518 RepID=UPI001C753536|nr:flavodoxin-dependent (E)-4-hydroxy-3-methylbut-2-enyl-diphosphate synthase [Christensenella sp. MSJ-20]
MASKRSIRVGDLIIGGGAPVVIQSMTNTDTRDVEATSAQIRRLYEAGCQLARVSVYDTRCAQAVRELVDRSPIPLVADIHFDHRLAIQSVENGIQKLRINPGNIGGADRVRSLVACAKEHGVPIRIGVNGGSLEPDLLRKYGGPTAEALVESALGHVRILEDCAFYDIAIAVKSSNVPTMVRAYRMLAERTDYPLHLGVTEAGTVRMGTVKSAVGIGSLLLDGIGDTIRVSLSGDPAREIVACKDILRSCGLLDTGVEIVSCPTCGRCSIDVEAMALALEERVAHVSAPIRAAVMGCIVNGPGEARDADIGIAGAAGDILLFRKGEEKPQRLPAERAVDLLAEEIEKLAEER